MFKSKETFYPYIDFSIYEDLGSVYTDRREEQIVAAKK